MEFIKKNRSAAAFILVIVVILSVLLGCARSVKSLENKVEAEFTKKDKYGETVIATTQMLILHINTFVSEYKAALGNCSEITVLTECAAQLETDNGVAQSNAKIDEARNAATLMHQRLDQSGSYSAEAKAAFAGIDNDISILKKYDSYSAAAKKYNDASESLIGRLFGMGKAIEF